MESNPISLDTIGSIYYAKNFDDNLFLFIPKGFDSLDFDIYKTYLDNELYNSTCYLVVNKVRGINKKPDIFTIINVPRKDEINNIKCIGVIISDMFFMNINEKTENIIGVHATTSTIENRDGKIVRVLRPQRMTAREYDEEAK